MIYREHVHIRQDRCPLRIPVDLRHRLNEIPGLTEGELRPLTKMNERRQRAAVRWLLGMRRIAKAG